MMRAARHSILVAIGLVCMFPGAAAAQTHSAVPVDLQVPMAPTKLRLVYELHITNFDWSARELALTRVEVLGDGWDAAPLAVVGDAELTNQMLRPGAAPTLPDKRRIASGMRAVVLLWLTVSSPAAVPRTLRHRLAFTIGDATDERIVEGATVTVRGDTPIVIGPPLRGEAWMAANGPAVRSLHRRAILAVDGKAQAAQRFAIDWLKFGDNGQMWSGESEKNSNWFGYGAEVLAVADGVVAVVTDGIPENTPPTRAISTFTLANVAGNEVILDLGRGRYAVYAHLQPGSPRVKVGDHVQRGQVLGLVGNSGNSDAPHLHLQICDAPATLGAEGLPFVFESFDKLGQGRFTGFQANGSSWRALPNGKPEPRRGEIPLDGVVVRFP